MRILYFNYEYPPLGGGAGRAGEGILKALAQRGHESLVITAQGPGAPAGSCESSGVQVIRLPCLRRYAHCCRPHEMLSYIREAQKILPELRERIHPDLVLSFFGFPSGIVGQAAARQFGCPHVISLRGMDVPGFDRRNLRWHHALLGPMIFRLWQESRLLIANSESLKKKALAFGQNRPLPPIAVVGNGLPEDVLKAVPLEKPLAPLRLLFAGRFAKQKGLMALLDILEDPEILQIDWCMDLVGDGPMRRQIEKRLRHSPLSQRVRLRGWLDRENLRQRYHKAHLLIMPSEDEGMSNVLLEALAHGLVVIARATGGIPELIQDGINGFLADETGLRHTVIRVLRLFKRDRDAFLQIAAEARRSVRKLSTDHQAERYARLLEPLAFPTAIAAPPPPLIAGKGGKA